MHTLKALYFIRSKLPLSSTAHLTLLGKALIVLSMLLYLSIIVIPKESTSDYIRIFKGMSKLINLSYTTYYSDHLWFILYTGSKYIHNLYIRVYVGSGGKYLNPM